MWPDGAVLRDTTGALWVIYGGARFPVRDASSVEALGLDSVVGVETVSLFTLSQIGRLPERGTVLREVSSAEVFIVTARGLEPFTEANARLGAKPWIAVVPRGSFAALRAVMSCLL
jgi:hypothetical protein